ncbi:M15 family metallopeptidase [Actinoplanes sp. KI2]|uniref:M15 family metallopeptidase n=1 Tax=Actinoplanes sp. KI2 TaxID=2983315 RepID=UPI0021D5958B|nr:M15 family metallopeptidase [Actinoplanes sp. KI2]MCU7728410.1 M15 family metallopeptidase [Actinoplanes sp. KI2]
MANRPEQSTRTRTRTRRLVAAAIVAALGVAGTPAVAGAATPGPAPAGPAAASWSQLMYRSLTATATAAQLHTVLATQTTAVATQSAAVVVAQSALTAAQAQVAAATSADTAARTRFTTANKALAAAKGTSIRASKQKPRRAAAVTRATTAVKGAVQALDAARARVAQADAVLQQARTGVQTATTGLSTAVAARDTASAAAAQTQLKLAAVGTPADLARQAAAVSQDVVSQTRAGFTVADTTTVYGITVNNAVAYAFKRMIDDAKAQGVVMSGGGFRTQQRQIELRTINGCPDVWTAPSSSCRVPTAIPGRSLHEIGLAVDISAGGKTITRSTPAFAWLTAHAAAYGFKNLPSEAWHWSITGS